MAAQVHHKFTGQPKWQTTYHRTRHPQAAKSPVPHQPRKHSSASAAPGPLMHMAPAAQLRLLTRTTEQDLMLARLLKQAPAKWSQS